MEPTDQADATRNPGPVGRGDAEGYAPFKTNTTRLFSVFGRKGKTCLEGSWKRSTAVPMEWLHRLGIRN